MIDSSSHFFVEKRTKAIVIMVTMIILMAHQFLIIISDIMSKEPITHVVENLVGCAVSLSAFYIVTDLNTKLALLQQINKEYHALANKLEDGNISANDLDVAAPAAKEKLPSELKRRDDFGLNIEAAERLNKTSPSKVDQIISFLKEKRTIEINVSLAFKEPKEQV
ncbi:MAG: hypothetical protein ACFFDP_12365 [Promethearchaeota archaeon]